MIPLSSSPGSNNAATQAHDIARQAEAALSRGRFEEAVSLHRQAAQLYHQATSHTSNPESIRALNLLSSAQNSKASELERLLCPTPTSSTQTFAPQNVPTSTTPQEKSPRFPTISPRSLSSPNFAQSDFYYSQNQHQHQQHQHQQQQQHENPSNNYQHSPLIDSPLPSPSSSSSSSSNCISPHSRQNAPTQTSSNTNPLASSMYEEENMLFIYPYNNESNNETISSLSKSTDLSASQHLTTESSTADQIFLLCSKDKTNNNNNNNSLGLLSSSPPSPESSRFWLGLEKLLDILPKPIFGQKYNTATGSSTSETYSENLNDKSSLMNSFYMVPSSSSSSSSHKTTPTSLTTTTTTTPTAVTQNSPQNTQSTPTPQLKDSGNLHSQTNLRGSSTIINNTNEDQLVKLQRENKHLQHVVELLNAQLSKGAQVKKENELLKQSILQFREEVQRKASLSRSVLYPPSSSVVPNNTTSSSSSSCVEPSFGKFSSSVPVPIIDNNNNNSRERDGGNFPSSSPAHPQLFQFSPSSSPQSPSPPIFKTEVAQNITPEQRIKALEDRIVAMSRELEEKDNIIRVYENRFAKLNTRKSGTQNPQSQSTVVHTNGLLLNNSTQSLTKSTL